jgi:hypothetical protein
MRQPMETAHRSSASLHVSQDNVQGFVPGRQMPAPLQVSPPLQYRPSLHGAPSGENVQTSVASLQPVTQEVNGQRAPAPTQMPALQASVSVQNWPSLQPVPFALGDQAEVLSAGWQDWHWLAGFVAPAR